VPAPCPEPAGHRLPLFSSLHWKAAVAASAGSWSHPGCQWRRRLHRHLLPGSLRMHTPRIIVCTAHLALQRSAARRTNTHKEVVAVSALLAFETPKKAAQAPMGAGYELAPWPSAFLPAVTTPAVSLTAEECKCVSCTSCFFLMLVVQMAICVHGRALLIAPVARVGRPPSGPCPAAASGGRRCQAQP
jgi:hypothetical protein